MNNEQLYFDTNRDHWNARTHVHTESSFYDVPSFKAGKTTLNEAELEALGDVSGKSLLHLQCHFGMDTLSFARMGAQVTGLDLADEAINTAKNLATEIGEEARFIAANVYDATEHLGEEQFDIVFTSYGTIVWLPDLDRWAAVIARHLKPGGTFCFCEFHPVWDVFDWNTFSIDYSYFNQGKPYEEVVETTYTGDGINVKAREYFWIHSLGAIFNALIKQGLQVKSFDEYDFSYYNCFPNLLEISPGKWQSKTHLGKLPMMFRLVMEKPEN